MSAVVFTLKSGTVFGMKNLVANQESMNSFGAQIGFKFNQDGSSARYLGNTVVSAINADNPAYPVLLETIESIDREGLLPRLILLPRASFHVTIIRGLNDRVRTAEFWPSALPVTASLMEMDRYVTERLEGIPFPASFAMTFGRLQWNDEDVRICLAPATPETGRELRAFRDRIADRLGLRLPGHDSYTFHTTLAYVHHRAREGDAEKMARITERFIERHAGKALEISAPYLAFYEDMMAFPRERK